MFSHLRICSGAAKIVAAAALTMAIAGCGSAHIKPAAPVTLTKLTPATGSRVTSAAVTVSGTVKPRRARVLVAGRRVLTSADGRFTTKVPLTTGANLIDVIAGAPRARPAMTAVDVVRYVLVSVPSVGGKSPAAAAAAIRAAGLKPRINGDGNPLSFLVPFSKEVCGQSPAAGTHVTPGSSVTISIGKVCL